MEAKTIYDRIIHLQKMINLEPYDHKTNHIQVHLISNPITFVLLIKVKHPLYDLGNL